MGSQLCVCMHAAAAGSARALLGGRAQHVDHDWPGWPGLLAGLGLGIAGAGL
jgi:hypothetical protein